jgi:hypothetical protein
MIEHAAFSALRLSRVFPPEYLASYPFYVEVDPEGDFDVEYLGGQWHEELIDGVQFFFPASDGTRLGVVELWAGGCAAAAAVRDRPGSHSASLIPSWTANANRALEVLSLPIRMGSPEAAVRALAVGVVRSAGFPDEWYRMCAAVAKGTLRSLWFACRAPDLYHLKAVVHSAEGLLRLEVRRPDVVRSNDPGGVYDACFAGLYDEGPDAVPGLGNR